jgi:hypothetical protein
MDAQVHLRPMRRLRSVHSASFPTSTSIAAALTTATYATAFVTARTSSMAATVGASIVAHHIQHHYVGSEACVGLRRLVECE